MSDASELIAQQIAAAGITPGELQPVGGVNKTYVDQQDALLQGNINGVAALAGASNQTANQANLTAGQAIGAANAARSRADQAFDEASSAFSISENALAQAQKNAAPSFNRVNDIEATDVKTKLNIVEGTGIAVTTNSATKTLTITATGQATPGAHAASHLTGESDPIPVVTDTKDGLMASAQRKLLADLSNPPRANYMSNVDKDIPLFTWTAPDWNVKATDTDSFIDQATPGIIRIAKSGTYLINALLTIGANNMGQRSIRILKNNDAANPVAYVSNVAVSNSHRLMATGMTYMNAGETLTVQVYQDANPTVLKFANGGGSQLTVVRVVPP